MLFLVDGDRISAEYAGNINLSMFNVANIEKIEVLENSLSSLYGSSAISGVVNIITVKPKSKYRFGSLYSNDSYLTESKTYYAGINFNNFYYDLTYMDRHSSGYDLTHTVNNPFDYTLKPYEDEMFQFKMLYNIGSSANVEFLYKDYDSFIINYTREPGTQHNMILSSLLKKFTDNIYKIKFNKIFNQNSSIKLTILSEVYDKINYYPYYYNESQFDLDVNPGEFISGGLEHESIYFHYNKKALVTLTAVRPKHRYGVLKISNHKVKYFDNSKQKWECNIHYNVPPTPNPDVIISSINEIITEC